MTQGHLVSNRLSGDNRGGGFWGVLPTKLRGVGSLVEEMFVEWNQDGAQRLGASVAFYTLFSLAPLLVLLVALVAVVFGKQAATGQLAWEMSRLVGREEAQALQAIVSNSVSPGVGLIATALSSITLVFSASSVAAELHDAMNTIWRVSRPPQSILRSAVMLIKERFTALAIVLGSGILLLLSAGLSAGLAAIGTVSRSSLPYSAVVLRTSEFLVSFAAITLALAAIYKTLPDVPLGWSDVMVGAGVTALLWDLGKQPIAFYLGKVSFRSTHGAAGSLAVILVWVYYSAQLFFLGAEFTKIYARRHGTHASGQPHAQF